MANERYNPANGLASSPYPVKYYGIVQSTSDIQEETDTILQRITDEMLAKNEQARMFEWRDSTGKSRFGGGHTLVIASKTAFANGSNYAVFAGFRYSTDGGKLILVSICNGVFYSREL